MVNSIIHSNNVALGAFAIPDGAMVSNQSEVMRKALSYIDMIVAKRNSNEFSEVDSSNQPLELGQVLSIIGGRGTGKTSVLISICDRIRKKYASRIAITKIFYPDRMPAALKMPLGPVLFDLIEKSFDCKEEDFDVSETQRRIESSWSVRLAQTYDVILRDSIGLNDWSAKLSRLASQSMTISEEFQKWVDEELKKHQKDLIVVPIDDADIAINRSEEVIELVRTYLNHPQIVTILACDIDALERRVRNNRLAELPPVPDYRKSDKEGPASFLFGLSPAQFNSSEAENEAKHVDAMLTKVIPPTLRLFLERLPNQVALQNPIYFPDRILPDEPLISIIEKFDNQLSDSGLPRLAPLFRKHPQILSTNFRIFINQYSSCRQSLQIASDYLQMDDQEIDLKWSQYQLMVTGRFASADVENHHPIERKRIAHYPEILSKKELVASQAQVRLIRGFLLSQDFSKMVSAFQRYYNTNLESIDTMHDLCLTILKRQDIMGTREHYCMYKIGETEFDDQPTSHFISFACDWLLKAGLPLREWLRNVNARNLFAAAFRPIQLPEGWAQIFKKHNGKKLNDIDSSLILEDGTKDGHKIKRISIPTDLDRLYPFFVVDMNALGAFHHIAAHISDIAFIDSAISPFLSLDELKGNNIKRENSFAPTYRIFGLLTLQTLHHLQTVELFIYFKEQIDRYNRDTQLEFLVARETSWTIIECKGIIRMLSSLFNSMEISDIDKLLVLAYISDLPMSLIWCCDQDDDVKTAQKTLLIAIEQLFDRLREKGVIKQRKYGSLRFEKIIFLHESQECGWLNIKQKYPHFDWERRSQCIYALLNGLKKAEIGIRWNGLTEPPPMWNVLAKKLHKNRVNTKSALQN